MGVIDLRKSAKGKPCVVCGQNDGTTVLHHIRVGQNGGTGLKPPDTHGIAVCSGCHAYFHGDGIKDYKTMLIAYLRQVDRWVKAGALTP